ncbi:acyl-CoA carboxylase epsilon subunit [Amycolatopsis sp. NPDC054798]
MAGLAAEAPGALDEPDAAGVPDVARGGSRPGGATGDGRDEPAARAVGASPVPESPEERAGASGGLAAARGENLAAQAELTDSEAAGAQDDQRAAAAVPAVRVVRGNPDDGEVAALLVALAAVGQAARSGREETVLPSPRQPSTRFVPATSWRAR